VAALVGLLRDQDEAVRRAAADTLAELKDPSMGSHLLAALEDADVFVRASAFRALRALRREESYVPALSSLAHADPRVRRGSGGRAGLPAQARSGTQAGGARRERR
jgi:HEAT repeat protein